MTVVRILIALFLAFSGTKIWSVAMETLGRLDFEHYYTRTIDPILLGGFAFFLVASVVVFVLAVYVAVTPDALDNRKEKSPH